MAQTLGPGQLNTNLTASNKMKVSLKGINSIPGNTNVRSSYGGNLSSRPGTSHRLMAANNYNTVGGGSVSTKNKNAKASTALGHANGSPIRLSAAKKKNLME